MQVKLCKDCFLGDRLDDNHLVPVHSDIDRVIVASVKESCIALFLERILET